MGSAAAARGSCASPWSAARRGLLVPSRRRLEGAPVGQTGVVAASDADALVSCRSALEAHGVVHDAGLVGRFRSDVARAGRGGAVDGAPARGLPPRTPDKVEVPPVRSPSSSSARCGGQAGAPRRGRDRPVHARRAEALRRHRPLVRRAGGQGRDARRRANRREADRRGRPPSGVTPPSGHRAAMPAGRPPPATSRSGVQTTPRSTASTRVAPRRCRLSADPQSSGQISAGHRRCGRRRWGRCEC